jgi:hydrogenase nickel incorporation protein HypB
MCTVCGCSDNDKTLNGDALSARPAPHHHGPGAGPGPGHNHDHHHGHSHAPDHRLGETHHHHGLGAAGVAVEGYGQNRLLRIEQDILGKNDHLATLNRARLAEQGIFALNLVSSPGSGKTTLLTRTIEDLTTRHAMAVIEGDQQTANDAERIRATGVPALQINTGKGCHLDAHMVGHALDDLKPAPGSVLFIENVGNLVCPAAFDLGEAHKVAILSVTEGEDKPLKYPNMFAAADLVLLNKVDLLPYLPFDVERCEAYARQVNPTVSILRVSAVSGEGMAAWYDWIETGLARAAGNAASSAPTGLAPFAQAGE